jgi:hypothetical protein
LRNQQIAMTHSLAIRLNPGNPDHHLWNNNGTWWCHYTVHPTPLTNSASRAASLPLGLSGSVGSVCAHVTLQIARIIRAAMDCLRNTTN